MSNINEKAIRIVAFTGKSADYRMWAARFMAAAHVKSYSKCLLQDLSKCEEIEQAVKEAVAKNEDAEDARMKARKAVKDGLSNEDIDIVMKAYTDIMLACTDEINFGIVFNAKSWIFPEGDAYLAWVRLRMKHQPTTNSQKIMLQRDFHRSRLGKASRSPDEWIEELELIRSRLLPLGVDIKDEDLILQILEGLPKEYDMLVTLLHARYKIEDLTIDSLREELNMFYDRMKSKKHGRFKSTDDDQNDNEESALIAGQFKGRCRGCGQFGHKKVNCPEEKKTNERGNQKFSGKCFHCGKKGHKKADCWQLKKKNQENANAVTEEADSDSEYALVSFEQVYDVGYVSSDDESINDIIDWRGRFMLSHDGTNDIIDYTDSEEEDSPFVKIDRKSWRKRRYWRDAGIDSEDESRDSVSLHNDNKYDALCCWCVDDDDASFASNEDESAIENESTDTDVDIMVSSRARGARRDEEVEFRELTESEKAAEADNIVSYEEQVRLELEQLEINDVFVVTEDSPQEPNSITAPIEQTYQFALDNPEVGRNWNDVDVANAFTESPRSVLDVHDESTYESISDDDDGSMSSDEYESSSADDGDSIRVNENEQDYEPVDEDNYNDSDETLIETISPEDEMAYAEGDDDITDQEFLTMDEWRQVIRNVSFATSNEDGEQQSDADDDAAYPVNEEENDKEVLDESIWLGDSGASAHMTMTLKGIYHVKSYNESVTVGNGHKLEVTKIGTKVGTVVQKNGEKRNITLTNVKYVPDLNCNLLSLTQALSAGFNMTGNKNGFWVSKGAVTYHFDRRFKSGRGELFGIKIDDRKVRTNINSHTVSKLNANIMHAKLGHCGETYTRETCRRLGVTIKGPFPTCDSCAVSKMKQKSIQKFTQNKATAKGERLFMDISSVKGKSSGGSKYWLLVIDEATQFQWSFFLGAKKETKNKIYDLITDLKTSHKINVKYIRCDNAGENKTTDAHLRTHGKGVTFEYTSSDTPQHNGVVERRFATLYGRVRSMLHFCRCPELFKMKIWAECASLSSDLWNIQVQKQDDKCPHELFFGTIPSYAHNLQIFGQAGVVLKSGHKMFKGKLDSRGDKKYFVGYAKQHHYDVYRMWNSKTGRVSVTRDIRWLDNLIGDDYDDQGELLSDDDSVSGGEDMSMSKSNTKKDDDSEASHSDDSGNESNDDDDAKSTSTDDNTHDPHDETESIDEDDMLGNPKLQRELRKLHTSYNPTIDELGDVAFVGGTDESYDNPENFKEAWDHPVETGRTLWREGIRKEFHDMETKNVWILTNICDIPENRRLIGCRWVNKVKRNGVHRARLVALGYSQIPGVDYTDNFAPVINDITFRIICVMIVMHGWEAEIVDIGTAFLYGDLDETIYMKIPDGYEIFHEDRKIDRTKQCFKLEKTIYGLTQAARQFFKKLSSVLVIKLKMRKCMADQCLFGRKTEKGTVLIGIYIDDTLCVGKQGAIDELKSDLKKYFSTKEEVVMKEYVGCEIERDGKSRLFIRQQVLLKKLDRIFGNMVKNLPIYKTPASAGFRVERCTDPNKKLESKKQTLYRSGIGILMFLVKYSRPDIANSVRELSKANDGATETYFLGLLRTIKYVLDTREKALKYETNMNFKTTWKLKAYCDSDFAGDKETRRSVSGYCIYLFDCLICWKSKGQKHATLSSTEAEYVAVAEVCTEIMFIRMILWFLGIKIQLPIVVHCDNVGAIFLSYNAKISQRTEHIDTKYRYVGEWVEDGIVRGAIQIKIIGRVLESIIYMKIYTENMILFGDKSSEGFWNG